MITCDFFSWALNFNFNYYHRIYHMLLFFNNNILTQSIIFLPVFSKYVLTRIRNIFPIQKSTQWFEYLHKHSIMVTYFRKVKHTWTRIRKDNKRLGFRSDLICRVEVYLQFMFRTCVVGTVKSFINLFLLLANLCFQVVIALVETRFLLLISYTLESFAKIWSFKTFHGGLLYITSKLMNIFRGLLFHMLINIATEFLVC